MKDFKKAASSAGMAGKASKPAKVVKEIRVRKGASGGHIIEKHHTAPEHHPMEEHATDGDNAMHQMMQESMGTGQPGSAPPMAQPDAAAQPPAGTAYPAAAQPVAPQQ
jgi:hypothetical protein